MSNGVAVQIRNLTKTIKNRTIVDNLTFDIPKGEVFGFLGPNGAGKTTTIRMIVGLISRTDGQVFVNGIDTARNFREAMAHIGVIVENPEMYKFLTGYQNLKHFAKMSQNIPNRRIDEVVKQVGLENRIHEKVKTYSLGMRQRLGLAQALLRNPSVLILDEPTNGLDPAGIRELRDYLRTLARDEGIAVVVSSHLLSEMELMCDRVAVIQAGKLIRVNTIQEMMFGEKSDETTHMELEHPEAAAAAIAILRDKFPELAATRSNSNIEVSVAHHEIPEIVEELVRAGIKLYAISTKTKTLEDTFLEMTGGHSIV